MACIYCFGNPKDRGGGGYYGQDKNQSGNDFPRIETHIDKVFKQDRVSKGEQLISEYGIGGLGYGYGTEEDSFGLTPEIFSSFCDAYGLTSINTEMKMHLAEFCFITSNHDDLSQSNVAMGGGMLTIDLRKWKPIEKFLKSKWGTTLPADAKGSINGQIQVSDVVDLLTNENVKNKLLYGKKYELLRLGLRAAPFYALLGDEKDNIKTGIISNFKLLLKDAEKAKKIIGDKYLQKLKKVCSAISRSMNSNLKQEEFNIDLNAIIDDIPNEIDKMVDFIYQRLLSALGVSSKRKNSTEDLSKRVAEGFVGNINTGKGGLVQSVYQAFTISRDVALNHAQMDSATKQLYTMPQGYQQALVVCQGKRPTRFIDENILKQYAGKHFLDIYVKVRVTDQQNDKSIPFLMDRMRDYYSNLFGSDSTVMTYGEQFYRAIMSIVRRGQLTTESEEPPYEVVSTSGGTYSWNTLGPFYQYWSQQSLEDIPFGGF